VPSHFFLKEHCHSVRFLTIGGWFLTTRTATLEFYVVVSMTQFEQITDRSSAYSPIGPQLPANAFGGVSDIHWGTCSLRYLAQMRPMRRQRLPMAPRVAD
jgi:hypothetical protein